MPTTDELQVEVDALTTRVEALETWVDAVVSILAAIDFRFGPTPSRAGDTDGTPRALTWPGILLPGWATVQVPVRDQYVHTQPRRPLALHEEDTCWTSRPRGA